MPPKTSTPTAVPASVGRPRLTPRQRLGMTAREEILDASAQLFSEQGYAGTSTRAIALAVGIKQASLYYHFANKEQILVELLGTTVVPSLEAATTLADRAEPPEVKLWAQASFDVRLLCAGRWNLGALYLLPELRSERFAEFRAQRDTLRAAYTSLITEGIGRGSFGADDDTVAVDLVLGLVASVVAIRQERGQVDADRLAPTIADGCLRLLNCQSRKAAAAGRRGARLLDQLGLEAA